MSNLSAVILAAGRGTRLGSSTQDRPKPMIEVGGRPILSHILSGLQSVGIQKFFLVTGYLSEVIEDYFSDGLSMGVQIEYISQESIDGTGGALRRALPRLGDQPFLLHFGDILISQPNYPRLVNDFLHNPSASLMAVNPVDDPYLGAAVYWDESTRAITRIVEKPPKGTSTSGWNQAGIFIFNPGIRTYVENLPLSSRGEYELTEAIHRMRTDGHPVHVLPIEGFWSDLGTMNDLQNIRDRLVKQPDLLESSYETSDPRS